MNFLRNHLAHFFKVVDHKALVFFYLGRFCSSLMCRALIHDLSKFLPDEASGFSKTARIYRRIPYGGSLYKESLNRVGKSLQKHYSRCRHHPQHYEEGITGMDLLDLVEMFYDWAAASKKQVNGSLSASIEKNKERFSIEEGLVRILMNERDRVRGERSD